MAIAEYVVLRICLYLMAFSGFRMIFYRYDQANGAIVLAVCLAGLAASSRWKPVKG
jgi:hypothetical protein